MRNLEAAVYQAIERLFALLEKQEAMEARGALQCASDDALPLLSEHKQKIEDIKSRAEEFSEFHPISQQLRLLLAPDDEYQQYPFYNDPIYSRYVPLGSHF